MRRTAFVLCAITAAAAAACGPNEPVTTVPRAPLPFASATPLWWPADRFGEGTHEVLRDIQAGRYRTDGPREAGFPFCFWYRLSGLSGEREEIISAGQGQGPTTVEIHASDKAFRTEYCADWIRVGDPS